MSAIKAQVLKTPTGYMMYCSMILRLYSLPFGKSWLSNYYIATTLCEFTSINELIQTGVHVSQVFTQYLYNQIDKPAYSQTGSTWCPSS